MKRKKRAARRRTKQRKSTSLATDKQSIWRRIKMDALDAYHLRRTSAGQRRCAESFYKDLVKVTDVRNRTATNTFLPVWKEKWVKCVNSPSEYSKTKLKRALLFCCTCRGRVFVLLRTVFCRLTEQHAHPCAYHHFSYVLFVKGVWNNHHPTLLTSQTHWSRLVSLYFSLLIIRCLVLEGFGTWCSPFDWGVLSNRLYF